MIKNIVATLLVTTAFAGLAAPAFAQVGVDPDDPAPAVVEAPSDRIGEEASTYTSPVDVTRQGVAGVDEDRDDNTVLGTPFSADQILAQLRAQGINAVSVDEWNGNIRAVVQLADGSTEVRYFSAI
jgi:hypothetical protein